MLGGNHDGMDQTRVEGVPVDASTSALGGHLESSTDRYAAFPGRIVAKVSPLWLEAVAIGVARGIPAGVTTVGVVVLVVANADHERYTTSKRRNHVRPRIPHMRRPVSIRQIPEMVDRGDAVLFHFPCGPTGDALAAVLGTIARGTLVGVHNKFVRFGEVVILASRVGTKPRRADEVAHLGPVDRLGILALSIGPLNTDAVEVGGVRIKVGHGDVMELPRVKEFAGLLYIGRCLTEVFGLVRRTLTSSHVLEAVFALPVLHDGRPPGTGGEAGHHLTGVVP
mmetsp:Transcript_33778/g.99537  ORF Transcript_33778/g.99537 Transcript_33778/m.99537 type:complete len:281 (+) Transcript_33778:1908-2750(+)